MHHIGADASANGEEEEDVNRSYEISFASGRDSSVQWRDKEWRNESISTSGIDPSCPWDADEQPSASNQIPSTAHTLLVQLRRTRHPEGSSRPYPDSFPLGNVHYCNVVRKHCDTGLELEVLRTLIMSEVESLPNKIGAAAAVAG